MANPGSEGGPAEVPACGCSVPGDAELGVCYCAVDDLLRIIRRRYSLSVLNAVQIRGVARFHDIEEALSGISTSTLSETLYALVVAGLLARSEQPDGGPRAVYSLTPAGAKLLSRLRRLLGEVRET